MFTHQQGVHFPLPDCICRVSLIHLSSMSAPPPAPPHPNMSLYSISSEPEMVAVTSRNPVNALSAPPSLLGTAARCGMYSDTLEES